MGTAGEKSAKCTRGSLRILLCISAVTNDTNNSVGLVLRTARRLPDPVTMLAMSVSDGERSQTGQACGEMGELGWGRPVPTGRQLWPWWCLRAEAAPASLCGWMLQGRVPARGIPPAWVMGQGRGSAGVHGAEVGARWFGKAAAHHLREQKKMSSGRLSPRLFTWRGGPSAAAGFCWGCVLTVLPQSWPCAGPGAGANPSPGAVWEPQAGAKPQRGGGRTVCSVMFNQDIGYIFKPEF